MIRRNWISRQIPRLIFVKQIEKSTLAKEGKHTNHKHIFNTQQSTCRFIQFCSFGISARYWHSYSFWFRWWMFRALTHAYRTNAFPTVSVTFGLTRSAQRNTETMAGWFHLRPTNTFIFTCGQTWVLLASVQFCSSLIGGNQGSHAISSSSIF